MIHKEVSSLNNHQRYINLIFITSRWEIHVVLCRIIKYKPNIVKHILNFNAVIQWNKFYFRYFIYLIRDLSTRVGEERGVYRVLLGKPEGRRALGRPRRRWVDNIRMDLQEVGCGYMDWIGLARDRDRWRTLVSAVMNLRVPWKAANFLTSCKPVSFSRRTLHHGVSK